MKYENLKEVIEICNKIGQNNELLKSLSSGRLTIILNHDEHSGRIMTIGADIHYEHDYTPLAVRFIEEIKTDLHRSNATMHEKLSFL